MTEIDPYNYPFPNKQQTMYLQTINQADAGFQKIKIIKPECTALRTNDISGNLSIKFYISLFSH